MCHSTASPYLYEPVACIQTLQFLPGQVCALVEVLVGELVFYICCSPQEPRLIIVMHQEWNFIFTIVEKQI